MNGGDPYLNADHLVRPAATEVNRGSRCTGNMVSLFVAWAKMSEEEPAVDDRWLMGETPTPVLTTR